MKKKTFINNPALQFLSTSQVEETETQNNNIVREENENEYPQSQYKLNPLYIEKKTRRVQLLMQPSIHAKAVEQAKKEGISLNEFIHKAIEDKIFRKE